MDQHMAINLNVNGGYHPPHSGGPVERAASATPERTPGSSQSPEVPDPIQLKPGSLSLSQLENKSSESPIDSEKVAKVKKAIADGSYKVDSRQLADNILKHEKLLSALRRVD